MWREAARYEPRMSADQRESLMAEWGRAVERSRGWVAPGNETPRGG
jgi:glycerol kinase